MSRREFDNEIRRKLEAYEADADASTWYRLEKHLDAESAESARTFDDVIRGSLSGFSTEAGLSWDRMEEKLNAEHSADFDNEVRNAVGKFRQDYDASTWPILLRRYQEAQRLRRRLIAAKVMEVAAVVVALFTFYNFFPQIQGHVTGALPIDLTISDESSSHSALRERPHADIALMEPLTALQASEVVIGAETNLIAHPKVDASVSMITHKAVDIPALGKIAGNTILVDEVGTTANATDKTSMEGQILPLADVEDETLAREQQMTSGISERQSASLQALPVGDTELRAGITNNAAPVVVAGYTGRKLKVTLAGSYDLNALYLPSDRFYADGYPIDFSEKKILAGGYSAGAGLLFDYGVWSFETGLFYSSKSYEPNRVLQIGQTFDVRTLDFEKISLHIINIPLQAHWNFDRKGKTRFYLVGGTGFDILASANYDLNVRKNFRSPFNGSNAQSKKRTDSQVARVREHILDGAEFSGKSFITVNAGIGVEHDLGSSLSIFAQPTYNYQVPFLQFSDKEGKHFQYASLQFGTRIRIR